MNTWHSNIMQHQEHDIKHKQQSRKITQELASVIFTEYCRIIADQSHIKLCHVQNICCKKTTAEGALKGVHNSRRPCNHFQACDLDLLT